MPLNLQHRKYKLMYRLLVPMFDVSMLLELDIKRFSDPCLNHNNDELKDFLLVLLMFQRRKSFDFSIQLQLLC